MSETDSPTDRQDRPDIPPALRQLASELTEADRRRVEPPAEVWAAISAQVAAETPPHTGDRRDRRRPLPTRPVDDPPREFTDTVELRSALQSSPQLPPVGRNPARTWLPAVAAVVIAIAGTALTLSLGGGDDEPTLAVGPLSNQGLAVETGQSGTARLVETSDGMALEITATEAEIGDGEFREVWLADPELDRLVSLGVFDPNGRYLVPAGLTVDEYPVVDVSVETLDGDPRHSGRSVLRATLEPANGER